MLYKDAEFPDDPEELYYWVQLGEEFNKDNEFSETMAAQGEQELDADLFDSLAGEGGILQAGSAPSISVAGDGGQQAFLEQVTQGGEVAQVRPARNAGATVETLKPKSPLELLGSNIE